MNRRYIISCFNRRTMRGAGLLSVFGKSSKDALKTGANMLRGTKCFAHDAEAFTSFFRRVKGDAVDDFVYRNWNPAMRPKRTEQVFSNARWVNVLTMPNYDANKKYKRRFI